MKIQVCPQMRKCAYNYKKELKTQQQTFADPPLFIPLGLLLLSNFLSLGWILCQF